MLLYGIPTAPGHSRVVMTFVGPKGSRRTRPLTPMLPPLLNWMLDQIDKVGAPAVWLAVDDLKRVGRVLVCCLLPPAKPKK